MRGRVHISKGHLVAQIALDNLCEVKGKEEEMSRKIGEKGEFYVVMSERNYRLSKGRGRVPRFMFSDIYFWKSEPIV